MDSQTIANGIWDNIGERVFNRIKVYLLKNHAEDMLFHYSAKLDFLVNRYVRSLPPHVAQSESDDLSSVAQLEFFETLKSWNPLRSTDIWPLAQVRILGAMKDHIRYITRSDPSRFYDWVNEAAQVFMIQDDRADFEHHIETGIQLSQAMAILTEREKHVIIAHSRDDLTFKQIGQNLNVSESQISRIFKKALDKIRKAAKVVDVGEN